MKTLAALLLAATLSQPATEQYAVQVYGRECITSIEVTDRTELIIPLDTEGRLDKAHAKLNGPLVHYNIDCGRLEIRHTGPTLKMAGTGEFHQ